MRKEDAVFNGNMRRDKEVEFTFSEGKGNTVIDYIMRNGGERED